MELYKKYRPKTFKEVVGQEEVIQTLSTMGKQKRIPHFLLLTGESGCGKTSLARILKNKLKCSDQDFKEINAADFRGIDTIREIRRTVPLTPLAGKVRVWLIDEVHKVLSAGATAFLKLLEDTPKHVYFIFATTHPQQLLKTIRTRATELQLHPLNHDQMELLIKRVAEAEGKTLTEDVLEKIIDHAEGSPRKGLVLLDMVIGEDDAEKQSEAIQKASSETEGIALARALVNPKGSWSDVVSVLKGLEADPEGVRRLVLKYCSTILLGTNPTMRGRAYNVMDAFRENFFNNNYSGLVLACFEAMHSEK